MGTNQQQVVGTTIKFNPPNAGLACPKGAVVAINCSKV